jgi:16S rRNA (guanine527-N7)-methyltransferase
MAREMSAPRGASLKLQAFCDLLLRWNRSVNLVSRSDEAVLWDRHIADSLQLAPLIPPGIDRAIDLGSGAGFPGLILAIETGIPFDLIEADHRKAAFLREAARMTDARVTVHAARIEACRIAPAPLITARALAPLPKLLALATPLLTSDGCCLFLKGANANSELTATAAEWHMRVMSVPSQTAADGVVLRLSEIVRVTAPN